MSFTVERALQRIQAENPGEHLPMEKFLRVIHAEEYANSSFFRSGPTGRQYRVFGFDCDGMDCDDINRIFMES